MKPCPCVIIFCGISLLGTAMLFVMGNFWTAKGPQLPSACENIKGVRITPPLPTIKLLPTSPLRFSYKHDVLYAKCEASYPVELVLDNGKIDRENLLKIWTQGAPCDSKENKIFSSNWNEKSFEPSEKFTMGVTCIPLCGNSDCVESVLVEYSGDRFMNLEGKALMMNWKNLKIDEFSMILRERFNTGVDDRVSILLGIAVVGFVFIYLLAVYLCLKVSRS